MYDQLVVNYIRKKVPLDLSNILLASFVLGKQEYEQLLLDDMQTRDELDFVIIGAQRAGTTSLFRYLQDHPQIFLPAAKEIPFFCDDSTFAKGWAQYQEEYFAAAQDEQKWGKVTPHYMIDPRVPKRIWDSMAKTRLIAILRDPVERAFSHYRLNVWRGLEKRPFADAILSLLEPTMLAYARTLPSESQYENKGYIVYGEYGRILQGYLKYFPPEQILVLFTEQLQTTAVSQILRFLDLDPNYTSPRIQQQYHASSSQKRISGLGYALQKWPFQPIWHTIPAKHREYITYWYHQWNQKPEENSQSIPTDIQQLLVHHYQLDSTLLQTSFGLTPPWSYPTT